MRHVRRAAPRRPGRSGAMPHPRHQYHAHESVRPRYQEAITQELPRRCQLGWGSAGSGRAGAGWAGCRWYGSGCGSQSGDLVPDGESSGHFGAIVVSGEAMAAGPEMRGDHAEHRQEPVGCAGGCGSVSWRVRVAGSAGASFRPVVEVPRLPVLDRRHHRPMRHRIASELVGDQHPRYPACLVSSLRKNRLAALASRRGQTRMSRTLPSRSTARHR